jgi:hypothetical protein
MTLAHLLGRLPGRLLGRLLLRPDVRRSALLTATGLAAVCALSACGVPPSDVIQAGEPATGMPPGITVYFLSGDGSLVGFPRASAPDLATAVELVFKGPTPGEAVKVSTRLPRLPAPPKVLEADGVVLVRLPEGVAPLSPPGMEQLVCTAGAAYSADLTTAQRAVPTAPPGGAAGAAPLRPAAPPRSTLPPGSLTPAYPDGKPRPLTIRVVGTGWSMEDPADPCLAG